MHLTRRDFAKTGLGGLLGSVLALVPGKAKAQVEPKPVPSVPKPQPNPLPYVHYGYPRWFRCMDANADQADVLFCMDSPHGVSRIHLPSLLTIPLWVPDNSIPWPGQHAATIADVVRWLEEGYWKEITAAEAEALLKPKRICVWKPRFPGPTSLQQYPLGTRRIGPDGQPQIYCKCGSQSILTTE